MELRSRTIQWYIAVLLMALMALLFGVILSNNAREMAKLKQSEAELRTRISEKGELERSLQLQISGGSTGSSARGMSFVLPDEICFEILEADLLDKYTEAEWKIIQQEKRLLMEERRQH